MEQLIEFDKELFLLLNNLGNPVWDDFWNILTNKWSSIPLYAVLIYLLYKSLGLKGAIISIILVAGMITITDQLANVFKDAFQRPRPCRQEGVMEFARFIAERCGRYGYFSAHAASSAALAIYMGLMLKPFYSKIFPVLIIWAAMVAYSRIYVGVHYPGDILTGMLLGVIVGWIFYKLQQSLLRKYNNAGTHQE